MWLSGPCPTPDRTRISSHAYYCYGCNTFGSNSQQHYFGSIPRRSRLNDIYQDMSSSRHSRRFPPLYLVSSVLPLPSRCLFLFYFVSRARSISVHIHSIHFRSCPRLIAGIPFLYSFHLPSSMYKYIRTCRHYCASLDRISIWASP